MAVNRHGWVSWHLWLGTDLVPEVHCPCPAVRLWCAEPLHRPRCLLSVVCRAVLDRVCCSGDVYSVRVLNPDLLDKKLVDEARRLCPGECPALWRDHKLEAMTFRRIDGEGAWLWLDELWSGKQATTSVFKHVTCS